MHIRSLRGITIEVESEKNILVMETENGSEVASVFTSSVEKTFENNVLNWPGEYEKCGWLIRGIEAEEERVIFAANIEDMTVVHLGTAKEIPENFFEVVENIDVLILPVDSSIRSVAEAQKLSQKIEARMIIPVGDLALNFVEASGSQTPAVAKAKISKNDLPIDKTEIISLIGA